MFCLCPLNNKLDQELHIEKLILSIFDLEKEKKKESNSMLVALTNSIILYGL